NRNQTTNSTNSSVCRKSVQCSQSAWCPGAERMPMVLVTRRAGDVVNIGTEIRQDPTSDQAGEKAGANRPTGIFGEKQSCVSGGSAGFSQYRSGGSLHHCAV